MIGAAAVKIMWVSQVCFAFTIDLEKFERKYEYVLVVVAENDTQSAQVERTNGGRLQIRKHAHQ